MPNSADRMRRQLLQALATLPLLGPAGAALAGTGWEAWRLMVTQGISPDGRVVDHSQEDMRTTSEGQSYALFFALVDNDQPLFDRILAWTQDNLAAGDMTQRLPAWLWGRDAQGAWRVLDENPAADSDLWLAYALLEAGRLWNRPGLQAIAEGMLAQVREREVIELPGLGPMLLPGPQGFIEADAIRVNPSYLPLPLLRRFAAVDRDGPWTALAANTVELLRQVAAHGFAPDWAAWRDGSFVADPGKGTLGSYDAIRCYLWAGMLSPRDRLFRRQLEILHGPLHRLRGGGPMWERVDAASGKGEGEGGFGFRAALLPYLLAQDEATLAKSLQHGLPTPAQLAVQEPAYYARMLMLFGLGWAERRYRFGADGKLQPRWN